MELTSIASVYAAWALAAIAARMPDEAYELARLAAHYAKVGK